jgi:tRNA-splicing endonuclease subunit Sen15
MAPSAISPELPSPSALQKAIKSSNESPQNYEHPAHLQHLAATVLHNLQYQHDWTSLVIHTRSSTTNLPLSRPIISGLPPQRAYIHPDEQAAIIKAEHEAGKPIEQHPEQEWVLPTHLVEKWSLSKFAAVFDALDNVPPTDEDSQEEENTIGQQWRGKNRQKRLLLATLHDDSTVVYYIMHDGIVKPRQN